MLDELAADWAAHAVVVMQCLDARGAEGVAAVHQDAGDALAHVVPETAELADVQTARTVVQVQDLSSGLLWLLLSTHHFLSIFSYKIIN